MVRARGESTFGVVAGLGLEGADREGTGVVGERMAVPGGSVVDPQGVITGTGIWEGGGCKRQAKRK